MNERTEAPKPNTKNPNKQQVEKNTLGTCTPHPPDRDSGAALGVLGYASAYTISINKRTSKEEKQPNTVKAERRIPHLPIGI